MVARGQRGMARGVAFIPAVPGLAPWCFYAGEGQVEGLPVAISPALQASERGAAESRAA